MARRFFTYEEVRDIRDTVLSAGPKRSHSRGSAAMKWAVLHNTTQNSVLSIVSALESKTRDGGRLSTIYDEQWAYLTGEAEEPKPVEVAPEPNGHDSSNEVLELLREILAVVQRIERSWQ